MTIFSKASGVNDSVFGKSQEPIKMYIEEKEQAFKNMSIIPHVYMEEETTNFAEKFSYETSHDDFEPVGENGAYPKSSLEVGYERVIEPEEWKNSFEITQTMIEDAKMGKAKRKADGFMNAYHRTREKFATFIINNGASISANFGTKSKSFDISAADGKALFATDHPSKTGKGSTQTNLYANAFSYDALSYAEERMQNMKDDDGELLNLQPDTILIPNKAMLKKLVFDAVGSDGIPDTANNSYSFQCGRWNVVWSPYLSNPSAATSDVWYILDSQYNKVNAGLVWLKRIELSLKSYVDENTDANIWKGRARFGAAPNDYRPISASYVGSGGTDLTA
ncbi:MAG: hypothetical protein WD491_02585 [Balneolales bacterium]